MPLDQPYSTCLLCFSTYCTYCEVRYPSTVADWDFFESIYRMSGNVPQLVLIFGISYDISPNKAKFLVK